MEEYNQRPETKIKKKEYFQKPEVKAKQIARQQTSESKKYHREYAQRQEVKEKKRKYGLESEVKARRLELSPRRNKRLSIRYKTEILYNLKIKMRSRIRRFLKTRNITKNNTTMEIVGCTSQELRNHIEKQFTSDMNWESVLNGKIHIDHDNPLDLAKTEEDVYRLCHYINLKPMWAFDNLSKGTMMPEEWEEYKNLWS